MSPAFVIPKRASSSRVCRPTPGIFATGSSARKAGMSSSRSMQTPSGLLISEQILARNFTGAAPMEHVSPPVAFLMAPRTAQTSPSTPEKLLPRPPASR